MCLCFVFEFETGGMCALSAVDAWATADARFIGFTQWIWQHLLASYKIIFAEVLRRKLVDAVAIAPLLEKACGKADKGGRLNKQKKNQLFFRDLHDIYTFPLSHN